MYTDFFINLKNNIGNQFSSQLQDVKLAAFNIFNPKVISYAASEKFKTYG